MCICISAYMKNWKNKHVLYTVYADIRACKKTHMHITTYRSISPWRGKWSKCGILFVFLELYCDQTVWFFPVTMLLPWTWPASWRLPLQCSCQLEMKYKKPWTATMLNCSDAIVHEICRCPGLMINTLQGGNTTPSGQHVGTAAIMWKGKWFNLNRPGLISFNGKRGNDKDWPIPRAFQLPGGNIGIPVLIFGLQMSLDSSLWSAFFAAVFSNMDL